MAPRKAPRVEERCRHGIIYARALAVISSGSRGRRVIPCRGHTDWPRAMRSSKFFTRLASTSVAYAASLLENR